MKGRRVPVILQMTPVECGAACLAMILSHFGRRTQLEECRAKCDPGRNGVTAQTLLTAAREFGLQATGYSLPSRDFGSMPLPCVVYWNRNHFVVLERWSQSTVTIVDPARGRREIPTADFIEACSGIVLAFEPGPEFERRSTREPSLLWKYLKQILRAPNARKILTNILGASILLQTLAFALPLLTKELVDRVLPLRGFDELNMLAAGAVLVALFSAGLSYARAILLVRLSARLDSELTVGFFKHLLSLPYRFFQQRNSGDLLMRLSSNAAIREALANCTTSTILDGALVVIFLFALLKVSLLFAGVALAIAAIEGSVMVATAGRLHRLAETDLASQEESQSCLVESLMGITTLKASGAEAATLARWGKLLSKQIDASAQRGRYFAQVDAALVVLRTLSPLVLLWLGARLVLAGTMTMGTMLAMNALAAAFLQPLASLVMSAQRLQLAGAQLERIADVMQSQPEQDTRAVRATPVLRGAIELRNVSFRYDAHSPPCARRNLPFDRTWREGRHRGPYGFRQEYPGETPARAIPAHGRRNPVRRCSAELDRFAGTAAPVGHGSAGFVSLQRIVAGQHFLSQPCDERGTVGAGGRNCGNSLRHPANADAIRDTNR